MFFEFLEFVVDEIYFEMVNCEFFEFELIEELLK